MNRRNTYKFKSLLLSFLLLVSLTLGSVSMAWAATADELEESMLGALSARYESNGDPGCISDGSDAGGKSYGSYMFASNAGSPKSFFEWCQASSDTYYQYIGDTLSEAYYYNSPGYGSRFDAAWTQLAQEDSEGFGRAQRDFVRVCYYDVCLNALAGAVPDFDVSRYSIALRNVIWSRTIQHGVGYYRSSDNKAGATGLIVSALNDLGTYAPSEMALIDAIYARSSAVSDTGTYVMYGNAAQRYGLAGKYLYYFSGNSSAIQVGVYQRLRYDEPAAAHLMLAQYGGADTADTNVVREMTLYAGCYPTYTCQLSPGNSSYHFGGILRGPCSISSVTAAILRADGTSCCSSTVYPDAPYCDLSQMDNSMLYSKLSAGEYITRITARDSSGASFLLDVPFRVGAASGKWEQADGSWYYLKSDGTYATGWYIVDGKWYFFNDDGTMHTGWLQYNGSCYYLKSSGEMATGWLQVGGKWYYFNGEGVMRTGWLQLNGTWYYLADSGAMQTGWQTIGGEWYYFRSSGEMVTGLVKLDGSWYYFDDTGVLTESLDAPVGWAEIGGEWYYFDTDHNMYTGWLQYGSQNKWYYFNDDGTMRTGWLQYGSQNKWYFFNSDGTMHTGWLQYGSQNKWYYFNDDGTMRTGWLQYGSQNKWYFFNNDGTMRTGWLQYGSQNKWYFFNGDGTMRTGWLQYGSQNKWYYFNGDGTMRTGWLQYGSQNKWYYFNSDGTMHTGWLNDNGSWYYLLSDGTMATNQWIGDYYVGDDGRWDSGKP